MITLSDEWFYGGAPRRRESNLLPALVLLLIILNGGLLGYIYVTSTRNQSTGADIARLQSSVDSLGSQLSITRSELSSLRQAVASGGASVVIPSNDAVIGQLYNRTRVSVVQITVKTRTGGGTGTGFIYDAQGHIVTNNHVVADATTIQVTFTEGTTLTAELKGRDPYSDMAVIKVNAPAGLLLPLRLGDSSKLKVGQTVVAIGTPFSLAGTLTSGIVSALGRQMDTAQGYPIVDVIQTDAAINPGNSGGPLLNLAGEVVGMNTAIEGEVRQSSGVGFAVPSNTIKREVQTLIEKGVYNHAYLGVTGVTVSTAIIEAMKLPAETRGTLITDVTKDGPAASAGLIGGNTRTLLPGTSIKLGGDVVTAADGKPMREFTELISYIQRTKKPGSTVVLTLIRNGGAKDITVTLGVRPQPT